MLDKLDVMILEELRTDGRISVTELSKRISSSRPTITSHLDRLRKEGTMNITAGLNIINLGLKMALVSLKITGSESRKKFYEVMSQCPRVQTIFRTLDVANIHVGVWGEDDSTIKSCIESLRDLPGVGIVDAKYLGTPVVGNVTLDLKLGDAEVAPCGKKCTLCSQYENERCQGCPVTIYYKNPLLKSS
jgi:DNA-binding Lrp family transcriptional regulator